MQVVLAGGACVPGRGDGSSWAGTTTVVRPFAVAVLVRASSPGPIFLDLIRSTPPRATARTHTNPALPTLHVIGTLRDVLCKIKSSSQKTCKRIAVLVE